MPRIIELPFLPSVDGTESFPLTHSGTTYETTLDILADWIISGHGVNRPPKSQNQTATATDTDVFVSGNVFTGVSDPDADAFFLQSLSYNGTSEPFNDGSFQTALGVFFLNPDTGAYVFTLGPGARALNIGETGHEIFTYTIADGRGGVTTSNLTITVTGTNSVPVVNSVNNYTPLNTTIAGNLIAHYAFDYEGALSVLNFSIEGFGGPYIAGSSRDIPSVGTLTINANGDYTFVPVNGWYGPVPLITYVLSDIGTPSNHVSAYLTLAITPLTVGAAPLIVTTSKPSGPVANGPNGKGCFLTIIGRNFGTTDGLGTTTKVYIGDTEVAAYFPIQDAVIAPRWPGMKALRVQLDNMPDDALGKPFPVTIVVGGNVSNANNTFIPNPGNFYYVSKSGSNVSGTVNDISKPFRNAQMPNRGDPAVMPLLRAGDQMIFRAGEWSDLGYDTAWLRFRDAINQGSAPTGELGTGWISIEAYPNEDVHYTTPPGGNKGGFQGPGSAFSGTTGDFICITDFRMEVVGGSAGDAAPVNMQYNTGHWWITNNNFGPWIAGDSSTLNAACVTGQGNFIRIMCNYMHDIEGTSALQNHGIYAGTSSYGWEVGFNWIQNMTGGSHIQFNDSDGGTGTENTPYGVWQGFTDCKVHHNFLENSAKYGITFSDVGAFTGDLSAQVWNNIIVGTGLPPLRVNTTTKTSNSVYAFNTIYDCNRIDQAGTGNGVVRNEGDQGSPGHSLKFYNNIFAFGPHTVANCSWFRDYSGQGGGVTFMRNLYFANGQTPTNAPGESMGIYADPQFANVDTLDFSLQATSPAINAGTYPLPAGFSVTDDFTAAATRQFGGAPDIGAMEVGQTTPFIINAPVVTGTAQVGQVTTCDVGNWGNSPTSYTRRAYVNDVPVGSSVTGTGPASYTQVAADSGLELKWIVSASNDGTTFTSYTVVVGIVATAPGAPVCTTPPVLTGTAQVPNVLSCNNGTWSGANISGYVKIWFRDGASTGVTGDTYTLGPGDVGHQMSCNVKAVDNVHGSVSIMTTQSAVVLASSANPIIVQSAYHTIPTTGGQPVSLPGAGTAGNYVITALESWDNATYNFSISDNNGQTSSAWTFGTNGRYSSDNPNIAFLWAPLTANGTYTQTINSNGSQGGGAFIVEITQQNAASIMDIAQDLVQGSTAAVALTASAATTKPNDLIFVFVAIKGVGHTITLPDSSWTQVGATHDGAFATLALFSRKISAIETFSFAATLDADAQWLAQSFVMKGS